MSPLHQQAERTTSSLELEVNLDHHGFEPVEGAPSHVDGVLTEGFRNHVLFEFRADGIPWWVEFRANPANDMLAPVEIYRDGHLVADRRDSEVPDVGDCDRWLQFVLEHIASEVGPS